MYILYVVVCHSQSKEFNSSFHWFHCSVTVMFPNRPAQRFPASTGALWNHGVSRYFLMDQESYGQPICWALSGLRWTRADVSGGVRWCPVVDDVWRWLKMFKDIWRPVSETEFSHQVYTKSSPSPCLAASSSPCLSAGLFFLQGNHWWRASGVVKIKTGPKIRVYFSNYFLLCYFSTISWVIGTQFWPIRCTAADQPALIARVDTARDPVDHIEPRTRTKKSWRSDFKVFTIFTWPQVPLCHLSHLSLRNPLYRSWFDAFFGRFQRILDLFF